MYKDFGLYMFSRNQKKGKPILGKWWTKVLKKANQKNMVISTPKERTNRKIRK